MILCFALGGCTGEEAPLTGPGGEIVAGEDGGLEALVDEDGDVSASHVDAHEDVDVDVHGDGDVDGDGDVHGDGDVSRLIGSRPEAC